MRLNIRRVIVESMLYVNFENVVVIVLNRQIRCIYTFFFFFQAEDGIRDIGVTGVQTCALPISGPHGAHPMPRCLPSCPRGRLGRRAFLGRGLAGAAASAVPRFAFGQSKQVNIYNWDTYIGETTLDDFTEATRIAARYDLFSSNDELFAKLREDNHGYDVIFPSNNYVERLIAAKMIEPLEHAKLPNIANLAQRFQSPAYDPGLTHS